MRFDALQRMDCPIEAALLTFFDIETTGLRPDRGAGITEIAVLGRDDVRFAWICEQDQPADAVLSAQLAALFDQLATGIVVGHNIHFDFAFIAYEADRLGLEGPALRFIDTLGLARRIVDAADDFRLSTLLHTLELAVEVELHTAQGDAWATRTLFWELVARAHLYTLGEAGLKQLNWTTF